jgi:hypothetical protein
MSADPMVRALSRAGRAIREQREREEQAARDAMLRVETTLRDMRRGPVRAGTADDPSCFTTRSADDIPGVQLAGDGWTADEVDAFREQHREPNNGTHLRAVQLDGDAFQADLRAVLALGSRALSRTTDDEAAIARLRGLVGEPATVQA